MKDLFRCALVVLIAISYQCSKDNSDDNLAPSTAAPVPIVEAGVATQVKLAEKGNTGTGADLEVSFSKAEDEALIGQYRLVLVKAADAAMFDLATAETLEAARYTVQEKEGRNIVKRLTATTLDIDGEEVGEGVAYRAFVLSMADGTNATQNALSAASNAVTLEVEQPPAITITYIGNDGVHISDGTQAVIIDALPGNLNGWRDIPPNVRTDLENGAGQYGNIKVAMVTHNHGDHFSPSAVNSFLGNHPNATYLAPPQARGGIVFTNQISQIAPVMGASATETFGNISIKVLHLRHFDLFGNDFSTVENYGYLVEMNGKKILHLGDVFFSAANLDPFDLVNESIDVVLIPTFNALVSQASKGVVDNSIAPAHIIGLHLQTSTTAAEVQNVYPEATVFTFSQQTFELH